ncbi:ORF192 [Saltwater crocodilepox virus]|nr:hypothetical protein [Saltwater crocodilepox virus]AVD69526.1 hypothetical protein [Saltwater crocodilepox virus]QGT46629.1 ORF192 [Saltwater crocodilepox virus]QGT46847.1 ORF192 [Saltwater crocodilepox virus]QGT47061.1 ORF192 [Saltwater crocodilepox virus]
MEIIEKLTDRETTFYYNPTHTICGRHARVAVHNGCVYRFFAPEDDLVHRYLAQTQLRHRDFYALGEIVISDICMLLIYINMGYYGVCENGSVYYLGRRVARLRLLKLSTLK